MRGEQASKMNEYERKVARLEREVEKYQTLAAIEELTRKAKRDLDTSPLSPSCDLKSFLAATGPVPESLVPKSKYCQTDSFYLMTTSAQTEPPPATTDTASSPIKELYTPLGQKSTKPLIQTVSPLPQQTVEDDADPDAVVSSSPVPEKTVSPEDDESQIEVAAAPSSSIPPPPPPPPPSFYAAGELFRKVFPPWHFLSHAGFLYYYYLWGIGFLCELLLKRAGECGVKKDEGWGCVWEGFWVSVRGIYVWKGCVIL